MHFEDPIRPNRRRFLSTSLGLAATAFWFTSCGPGAAVDETADVALPDGVDRDDFIVFGENPWTFETKRDRLRDAITPRRFAPWIY